MSEVADFFAPTAEERFDRVQVLTTRLARHRAEVRNETPSERARRQQHRAYEVARGLGSTRPNMVKAMLALVQADEHTNPNGDPPAPVAPGARAALKPKSPKSPRCSKVNTPVTPDQEGLF